VVSVTVRNTPNPKADIRVSSDLIDTLLSIHSLALPLQHIITAYSQIKAYHERFQNRLKPVHALHIRQAMAILGGLAKTCREWEVEGAKQGNKETMMKVNDLVSKFGGGGDQINLIEMVEYLKDSHLARKVSGYAEKQAMDASQKGEHVLTQS
jgi:chromosome transmission fidelity protein 1